MVSASVVDDRNISGCFVESSNSGLLQPLKLCVAPPSPKLCVTPPTPNLVSPTSPPQTVQSSELPKENFLPTVIGSRFPGVAKLKPKKKKFRQPVLVLPRYLAAGSRVDHSIIHQQHAPHLSRPEIGRHFSQPVAVDLQNVASLSYKKLGRSTQSLTNTPEETASLRNLLKQEDMRIDERRGNRISRGLRAIRLFPQNKLSKRLIALKTKFQSDVPMNEEEIDDSNSSLEIDKIQPSYDDDSDVKKAKVKFTRRHSRSSSDSVAAAIVKSLMESNISGLDRVVEVKESPGSSPTSPSRKESHKSFELTKHVPEYSSKESEFEQSSVNTSSGANFVTPPEVNISISESFLRLPSNDDGPELRYVDGHLISNTSSNVSSTSDSSSSEEDASEDYSLDVPIKDRSPFDRPTPSPVPMIIPSKLDIVNTENIIVPLSADVQMHHDGTALQSPFFDNSSADVTPIDTILSSTELTFDEPLILSTVVCTADSEKTSDIHSLSLSNPQASRAECQQMDEVVINPSFIKSTPTTKSQQDIDIQSASIEQDNDLKNVPSIFNKTVENTKIISDQNFSSFAIESAENHNSRASVSHMAETASSKNELVSHRSEVSSNILRSSTPISESFTNVLQETIPSKLEESLHKSKATNLPLMPSILKNDFPHPITISNVLPNQENVEYNSASVEQGFSNSLSTDNSVYVASRNSSPLVKIDSDAVPQTSACELNVLDVGGSCKTNSVIGMQKSPVGEVSVIGMLKIPSPLHKSHSATTILCSCPTATVEHDTNDEQASPCCDGDLQFHNIKHGPCFVPPSRQQQQQLFPGGEDEKQQAGSPPSSQGGPPSAVGSKISPSPAKLSTLPSIHRRSSDSDLSITPKGNSLTGSDRSSTMGTHFRQAPTMVRPSMNQESLDMMEYPFITMSKYPAGFILHLGGTVSSRSVKLLERITNLEEPETRDAWWTEIRMEVRSHARALGCNVVLGYCEHTSICDDVCVLSASGTAAMINLQFNSAAEQDSTNQHVVSKTHLHNKELMTTSLDRTDFERDKSTPQKGDVSVPFTPGTKVRHPSDGYELEPVSTCSVCHIPYSESSVPFRVNMLKCAVCRRGKVPDVLFTTIELPEGVATTGKGCFLQAYVCRPKRDCRGELNAKEISDGLPFLEYELHRVLINKLKVKGMNSIFGLKVQVSIGEKMLVGLATGTAVLLAPLPSPPVPKVSAGNSWADDKKLAEIQKLLQDTVKKNREFYQLKSLTEHEFQTNGKVTASDTEESDDELPDLDLATGNKDTCVLEVDDAEDVDVISLLIDPRPPEGFHVVNTETIPGLDEQEIVRNLQMFTQVWRAKIPVGQPTSVISKHFHRLLQSVYFKLRRMIPCALCDLQFGVELPEPDELQISVLGMALGLGEPEKPSNKFKKKVIVPSTSKEPIKKTDDCELIFNLDEDHVVSENPTVAPVQAQLGRPRPRSPLRIKMPQSKPQHTPPRERYGVDMTPLSYVPGGKIERYLGNLNFFFIRESTCIREGGGLSGFVHSFVTEVLAIVRAHVTALGGNAIVAYFMSECVLYHNPHKNQGQCLINVGGDVVYVTYYSEE